MLLRGEEAGHLELQILTQLDFLDELLLQLLLADAKVLAQITQLLVQLPKQLAPVLII